MHAAATRHFVVLPSPHFMSPDRLGMPLVADRRHVPCNWKPKSGTKFVRSSHFNSPITPSTHPRFDHPLSAVSLHIRAEVPILWTSTTATITNMMIFIFESISFAFRFLRRVIPNSHIRRRSWRHRPTSRHLTCITISIRGRGGGDTERASARRSTSGKQ